MFVVLTILLTGTILLTHYATADSGNNNYNETNHDPHCDVTVNGENPANNAIQTAINHASSGNTICLTAAVYPENIVINQPLTLEGVGYNINSSNSHDSGNISTLKPTTLVTQTSDVDSSNPLDPIILVENGATGVTIKNLEVDGSAIGSKLTDCGDSSNPEPIGIMFQSSSGTIDDVITLDVESDQALFGCQTDAGLGIFIQAATGHNSNVLINDSNVTNYQKNGITCNDAGTTCVISRDVVVGAGQTTLTAQNGIQIAFGATGTVKNSQISGDSYIGTSSCPDENYFVPNCYQATGVLLYDAPGVVASGNQVSLSDIGIAALGFGDLHGSNDSTSENTLLKNYGYGVVFDSFNGTSQSNSLKNNPVGLLVTDDFANANVTSINDQFLNNLVNSEALGAPGSTWFADLVVETSGHHEHMSYDLHYTPHFHAR